jgi:hypothetical protein
VHAPLVKVAYELCNALTGIFDKRIGRHCSRDPGFDMDMASNHFYTTGSNHFSRGANDVWTG